MPTKPQLEAELLQANAKVAELEQTATRLRIALKDEEARFHESDNLRFKGNQKRERCIWWLVTIIAALLIWHAVRFFL